MKAVQVDVVELGFRFLKNQGFKGPCAFTALLKKPYLFFQQPLISLTALQK